MTSSNSSNDSFFTDEQGVEIRSHHVEEGDVLAMTQTDAHSNGNVTNSTNTNNTKGGLGNTAVKALCGTAVLATVGSASYGAGVNSAVAKMNSVVTSQKASAGGKSDKSKAGKRVCVEYGFVNDVVIKGSENPLQGPTGEDPDCAEDGEKCFLGTPAPRDFFSGSCNDWLKCLENNPKDDGPAFNNPWFMNRDVSDGQILFEDGRVCANIPNNPKPQNGKARMELWDATYLNEPLDRFKQFKVPYDIIFTTRSPAYVDMYLRVNSASTTDFDCRYTFLAPTTSGTGEILIDLDKPNNSGTSIGVGDPNGCASGKTLQEYIDANNGAVMGVGNGEWYTFAINNGSKGVDNHGERVCWGKVEFTRVDANDVQFSNNYKWTTL